MGSEMCIRDSYDSVGTATQGIGDGNVTLVRQYDGEGIAWRDSVRVYDRRNRLVQVWGPTSGALDQAIGPHEVRAYDNLDRLVERGLFSKLSSPTHGGNQDALIAASGTDRLLYSRISYSQRGLPFRTAIATAPASLSLVNDIAARNKTAFGSLVKDLSLIHI